MIDKELLKACTINSWSVTPRMMLIDSMIENGWEEFKSMEAFELPTVSRHLPKTYGCHGNCYGGVVDFLGSGIGYGIGCGSGIGYGSISDIYRFGIGNGIGHGSGNPG